MNISPNTPSILSQDWNQCARRFYSRNFPIPPNKGGSGVILTLKSAREVFKKTVKKMNRIVPKQLETLGEFVVIGEQLSKIAPFFPFTWGLQS